MHEQPPHPKVFLSGEGKDKLSINARLIIVALLVLVLLISSLFISALIRDREYNRDIAVQEASSKWGNEQIIVGPILTIPYEEVKDSETRVLYAHFLPDMLNVRGNISSQMLKRGIYELVVYDTDLSVSGRFDVPDLKALNIADKKILWEEAFVSLGFSDMRGIRKAIELSWDNGTVSFSPGIPVRGIFEKGVSTPLVGVGFDKDVPHAFSYTLVLQGSKDLSFIPLGKETNITLTSDWESPSFSGAFLPIAREVGKDGFSASWKVLEFNRNFPQQWTGSHQDFNESSFGVRFFIPVDEYQKASRAVKYAIMFIALTFFVFFFVEIFNKVRIHAVQYLLVGFALVLFYTLLISISEHLNFATAYLIASIATTSLITLYSKSIFKKNALSVFLAAVLLAMYVFLYIVLQSQDYALLIGSVGLFVVLAIVMFITKKVDWGVLESK